MGLFEPHGRYRQGDGGVPLTAGVLAGIARKPAPRAAMIELDRVLVTPERGIEGDCRGTVAPGGRGRRQVTVMAAADWAAATAELGRELRWSLRRANLMIDGIALPQRAGAHLRIGAVLLRVTCECDPCFKMEWIAPGLEAALTPDWRGGVCARVIKGGAIGLGDTVSVED